MNKKILVFIYNGHKFLALRNNPKDKSHGGDFWFTVTGSIESGESSECAVKREIMEETGLEVEYLFYLNWDSIYPWGGKDHLEKNHLAFVKSNEVKLDNEHIEYKWLELKSFVKKIKWDLDKKELQTVLEMAIKKELFYKKAQIVDFRNSTLNSNIVSCQ